MVSLAAEGTPGVLAVNDHLRVLASQHPLDIESGGIHQVKPWFEGRLDFAPVVSFLGDEEFPLRGGAVVRIAIARTGNRSRIKFIVLETMPLSFSGGGAAGSPISCSRSKLRRVPSSITKTH